MFCFFSFNWEFSFELSLESLEKYFLVQVFFILLNLKYVLQDFLKKNFVRVWVINSGPKYVLFQTAQRSWLKLRNGEGIFEIVKI